MTSRTNDMGAAVITVDGNWIAHSDDIDCADADCHDDAHKLRHVGLRILTSDGQRGAGEALFARDPINGGWCHVGDSVDCWLTLDVSPQYVVDAICQHLSARDPVGSRIIAGTCQCPCCDCEDPATETDHGVCLCASCADYAVDDDGDVVCSLDPRYVDDGEWTGGGMHGSPSAGWVRRPRVRIPEEMGGTS